MTSQDFIATVVLIIMCSVLYLYLKLTNNTIEISNNLYGKNGNIIEDAIRVRRRGKWQIEATDEFTDSLRKTGELYPLNNDSYLMYRNVSGRVVEVVFKETYNLKHLI